MEALIETIAVSAGLLVFCIILGFIYFLIRRYKTISLIYLIVSVVFLLHILIVFVTIYVPGLLPGFLSQYAFFWFKRLM
ncbi:MAG: hypothetical protein U5R49_26425 [Deltaproteobacteria bacterium]|nr:hypothetical protein [Deltaproteobacteria bacterium]